MPVVRPAILPGALLALGAALAPGTQARPFDPVAPE